MEEHHRGYQEAHGERGEAGAQRHQPEDPRFTVVTVVLLENLAQVEARFTTYDVAQVEVRDARFLQPQYYLRGRG